MHLDSYPDMEITGSVKSIAQTAIKARWMAKAKVFSSGYRDGQNGAEIMKAGMLLRSRSRSANTPNQLLFPRSAVNSRAIRQRLCELKAGQGPTHRGHHTSGTPLITQ